MTSEANKQVALKFIHAMSEGDAAGQAECLAPDAFTVTKGFAQVSGTRNRETMLATVEAFKEILPTGFRPKFEKVVAEGDTVVVEWEGDAVLSNGVPYANQYVFIFSFENGRIRQLNEYFCTVLADSTILPLLAEKSAEMAHGN
ncbi:nuclear transport factor 2 family protein [Novosphingobium mangrovi (ex Huang et al. 2023)]|uniref:Nuclear transport factor 2 family protein n=1 Tax=Novosphingobium mangrovi (ex Huang et al. 2023) TaxID=2976432 RepID=A0ABT2I9N8_9SPHN|nr:nuclear transport factor 2 family protein [Novosphingobium mangrovi (ex Huang et al. 2023)]MCT2401552.1 nuclear transport factor 2 family protein [Novosphingobium mangrovi (ex Huang et al. 2023)]